MMIKIVCVIFILVLLASLPYTIEIGRYRIVKKGIHHSVRICVLADLHCQPFGKSQEKIAKRLEKIKPDLVVIPGDLFDVDRNYENAFALIERCQKYPTFYVLGNHDAYLKDDLPELIKRLECMGVTVLQNEQSDLMINGTKVNVIGLKDQGRKPTLLKEDIEVWKRDDAINIVLSHRPEYTELYHSLDVDLIISGHAHGGQWRIPFIHQGIYAPQQGFLPKYTEGIHTMRYAKLAISRGLASGNPHIPRLFNRPEIMVITIEG